MGFADSTGVPPAGRSGWGGGGFWKENRDSIWITFSWIEGTTWYAAAAVSRDGAESWQLVKVPNQGGQRVGLGLVVGTADEAGNVYLAWAEQNDKRLTIWMASSSDDGGTWSDPHRVDDTDGAKVFPAMAAGAPGKVAIAYYETNETEVPMEVTNSSYWHVKLAWTDDALSTSPDWERDVLSTAPLRKGPICTSGSSCPRWARPLLDYFALRPLPDGRVGSVWTSTQDVSGQIVNVYGATNKPILM